MLLAQVILAASHHCYQRKRTLRTTKIFIRTTTESATRTIRNEPEQSEKGSWRNSNCFYAIRPKKELWEVVGRFGGDVSDMCWELWAGSLLDFFGKKNLTNDLCNICKKSYLNL